MRKKEEITNERFIKTFFIPNVSQPHRLNRLLEIVRSIPKTLPLCMIDVNFI